MGEPSTKTVSAKLPVLAEGAKLGLHGGWYVAIATVTLARGLAIALLPLLLVEAPLALILMSPTAADLVIAAPLLAAWLYFTAAMVAAVGQTAIAYHFGRALGDRALLWLQSRSPAARRTTVRLMTWLERAAPLVMLALPGLTVGTLAGLSGVPARRFYAFNITGNLLWTIACFAGGTALTEQLEQLYTFVGGHMIELTVVAASLVGVQLLWTRYRRKRAAAKALAREEE